MFYLCGPVVKRNESGQWKFVSAGPTTSAREEPYQSDVIKEYKVRGVIGKGGMGSNTAAGLQQNGAVYLHAVGGAGTLIANTVKEVIDVFKLEEFGTPEAFWVIRIEELPLVVTMDSHGGSLHKDVMDKSRRIASDLIGK
ncbi:MAG: fumarate hydratase C-terminal domain-containing protein [Calditrichaceae bacterium]